MIDYSAQDESDYFSQSLVLVGQDLLETGKSMTKVSSLKIHHTVIEDSIYSPLSLESSEIFYLQFERVNFIEDSIDSETNYFRTFALELDY